MAAVFQSVAGLFKLYRQQKEYPDKIRARLFEISLEQRKFWALNKELGFLRRVSPNHARELGVPHQERRNAMEINSMENMGILADRRGLSNFEFREECSKVNKIIEEVQKLLETKVQKLSLQHLPTATSTSAHEVAARVMWSAGDEDEFASLADMLRNYNAELEKLIGPNSRSTINFEILIQCMTSISADDLQLLSPACQGRYSYIWSAAVFKDVGLTYIQVGNQPFIYLTF